MKVIIRIDIGNDAMQTFGDVNRAIIQSLGQLAGQTIEEDETLPIFDLHGNKVGTLEVD